MSDLLKLAAMPKIQVLGYELLSEEDQKKFKEIMPHLCNERSMNEDIEDYAHANIAMPHHRFNPTENIWEVEAELRTYDVETLLGTIQWDSGYK